MSLGMAGLLLRFVVLTGAVVFSFLLLFYGFYIVFREYRLVNTFPKLEKYLKLTSEVGLQADAAKGTLGLSRATPGLLLTVIGALILIVTILQKYDYSRTEEGPTASQPLSPNATAFEETVSQALRDLDSRVTALEQKSPRTSASIRDGVARGSFVQAVSYKSGFRPGAANEQTQRTQETMLLRWLSSAQAIEGMSRTQQIEYLQRRYGVTVVTHDRFMLPTPMTPESAADRYYGHARYAPLLLAFNPSIPKNIRTIPRYTFVLTLYPNEERTYAQRKNTERISIAGMSREQLYDEVLSVVQGIMSTEEYQRDPTAWWQKQFPDLGVVEFARVLTSMTGRPWGIRSLPSEEDDTPQQFARVRYGDRKYWPILKFLNYSHPELFGDPRMQLPVGTPVVVAQLTEFGA
jgi:hypothetical protein